VDLTETNPTAVGLPPLETALPPAPVYAPDPRGRPEAREAVARLYGVPADRVILTASTSEAYSWLFKLLCDPGDEVLVPQPSYPLFEHLTRLDGVSSIGYQLDYHGRWSVDLSSVERALSPRTRALLVVSPNNPTGNFISQPD